MTNEQIIEALGDRNLAEVGRRIGVTRSYLQAIRSGKVTKLSDDFRQKLSDYLSNGVRDERLNPRTGNPERA